MERDFTDAKLNELLSCIYKENDELKRIISGIGSTYSHWSITLGLDLFSNIINSFLKMNVDKNDTATKRLKSIFTDARNADSQYKSTFINYRDGLTIYKDFIKSMAETVQPSKTNLDVDTLKNRIKDLNLKKSTNMKNIAIELITASKTSGVPISEADKIILNKYADVNLQKKKDGNTLTQIEEDFLKDFAAALIAAKKNGEAYSKIDKGYLEKYLDYLAATKKTGNAIKTLSTDDRDWAIKVFEEMYPNSTADLNKFFKDMKKDKNFDYSGDINNIKYIVYTSDEKYRSIFFRYLDDLSIADYNFNDKKSQKYSPSENKLYLRFHSKWNNEGLDDPRGPYATFFHEYGHGIDDVAYNDTLFDDKYMTQDYTSKGNKVVFQEAAEQDVRSNINASVKAFAIANGYTISDTIATQITAAIMAFNGKGFNSGTINEKIYNGVISQYKNALGSSTGKEATVYCGISDVYGGFSDNKLIGNGGYRHDNVRDPDDGSTYWNSSNGTYSGMQGKELWAETFSRYMTGNKESIKELNSYFPTAIKKMDEALDSLKGEKLK